MTLKLFRVSHDFFHNHLDGRKIPIFLHAIALSKRGCDVFFFDGQNYRNYKYRGTFSFDNFDGEFDLLRASTAPRFLDFEYDLFVQKNVDPAGFKKGARVSTYILNDSFARQNLNQLFELLVGGFPVDLFRLKAFLKLPVSLFRDFWVLRGYNQVYVQTWQERHFLNRIFQKFGQKIKIFSNATMISDLFDLSVCPKKCKNGKILIGIPSDKNRKGEVYKFLNILSRREKNIERYIVLAPSEEDVQTLKKFNVITDIDDYNSFLSEFNALVVPTKHYTGQNNRVLFSLLLGTDVYTTKYALDGFTQDGSKTCGSAPKTLDRLADNVVSGIGAVTWSDLSEMTRRYDNI